MLLGEAAIPLIFLFGLVALFFAGLMVLHVDCLGVSSILQFLCRGIKKLCSLLH